MTGVVATTDLHQLLERHFGFREFLEGQEAVIGAVQAGQDALVIMPTGGGKSLCYQLPALMLEGLTVVVSPLIALMKDQVDGLAAKGIPATFINSSLAPAALEERIRAMVRGDYRLVYIAPERFKSERFVQALAPLTIALFAIDEAHCISQWGHDFRPDYLRLKWALQNLGQPQVMALTATATPEVRDDILEQLGLGKFGRQAPRVFVSGFARHNLTLAVSPVGGKADKLERLLEFIRQLKTGIVYGATRKNVEKVAAHLRREGVRCVAYHGAMADEDRKTAQDKFMSGGCGVAVATNAFGMGIDRPDLRFVVHYDIPGSVEAYYQEAGRAGRDGEPARCELLFNYADVRTQDFFIEGANPTRAVITSLYHALRELCGRGPIELPISEIAAAVPVVKNEMAVGTALYLLQRAGFIQRDYRLGSRTYTTRLTEPVKRLEDLPIDFARLEAKHSRDGAKLQRIIEYAYHRGCRHQFILRYFGDADAGQHCRACDNCLGHSSGLRPAAATLPAPAARPVATPRRTPVADTEKPVAAAPPVAKPVVMAAGEKQVLLQKALSCVARMKGRFGLGRITLVLVGSRSKEVFDAQLDKLSTYGLLREYGYDFTLELLRRLAGAGCIRLSATEYPTAALTELGAKVMQAAVPLEIELPEYEAPRPAARAPAAAGAMAEAPYDEELFEVLRKWRRQKADALGVPAFVVYPDRTLKELCRRKPQTADELLTVRGIGPAKARQFGAETVAVIVAAGEVAAARLNLHISHGAQLEHSL